MADRWDTVQVDSADMQCYVSEPAGSGPFPAVVVAQHVSGVDAFIQSMCDRLAEAGYVAVAPDLYHRDDPSSTDNPLEKMARLRDPHIVADCSAAIEHAKALANVRADRIGITGFCMGGRVAYLVAVHRSDLGAAVVFYGGNIMVPWGEGPAPFQLSDRIACPVLGLFGAEDGNPGPADVEKLDAELTRLGKPHQFHSYPGAGHAFMNEGRPSYREQAAGDAWSKGLAWFDQHLK